MASPRFAPTSSPLVRLWSVLRAASFGPWIAVAVACWLVASARVPQGVPVREAAQVIGLAWARALAWVGGLHALASAPVGLGVFLVVAHAVARWLDARVDPRAPTGGLARAERVVSAPGAAEALAAAGFAPKRIDVLPGGRAQVRTGARALGFALALAGLLCTLVAVLLAGGVGRAGRVVVRDQGAANPVFDADLASVAWQGGDAWLPAATRQLRIGCSRRDLRVWRCRVATGGRDVHVDVAPGGPAVRIGATTLWPRAARWVPDGVSPRVRVGNRQLSVAWGQPVEVAGGVLAAEQGPGGVVALQDRGGEAPLVLWTAPVAPVGAGEPAQGAGEPLVAAMPSVLELRWSTGAHRSWWWAGLGALLASLLLVAVWPARTGWAEPVGDGAYRVVAVAWNRMRPFPGRGPGGEPER